MYSLMGPLQTHEVVSQKIADFELRGTVAVLLRSSEFIWLQNGGLTH